MLASTEATSGPISTASREAPERRGFLADLLPTVNTELFSLALGEFAKEVGAGEDKHILLVVDKAGWHSAGEVRLPEGVHLEFLPPGSPELQPAERLWPLSNEALANGLFEEIEEIEQTLMHRCVELLDQAELIEKASPTTIGGLRRHEVPNTIHPDSVSAAKRRESVGTMPTQSRLSRWDSAQACSESVTLHPV